MDEPIKDALGRLEEERDHYKKQWWATQEMLAQVLLAVGEPVVVLKTQELPEGAGIAVDYNPEDEAFVFYLEAPKEDATADGS
jgi:hypothetical protein